MLRDEPWRRYRHLFTTAEERIRLAGRMHVGALVRLVIPRHLTASSAKRTRAAYLRIRL
jgi:hypothetical protein